MRYFFIVNPVAGKGRAKKAWERLLPLLERRRTDFGYALTKAPGEATHMARDVVEAGYEVVVGVGGDGTLQEIAAGLPPEGILGIIPAGTGNDFSHNLNIPRQPEQAFEALFRSRPLAIDRCRANGRPFLNVAGVGFDAKVAREVKEKGGVGRGALPYLLAVFRQLAVHRNYPVRLHLDGRVIETTALLVAVGNGQYLAGGMHICPRARLDDGLFDVCIAGDIGKLDTLINLVRIFRGTHIRHPKVAYLTAREVRIEGDGIPGQADGEPIGETPIEFRLEPGALRVMAPQA